MLDELPDDQREVVMLRHYAGLSFKEIADQTDVSINTALGRMRYALINMQKVNGEEKYISYGKLILAVYNKDSVVSL